MKIIFYFFTIIQLGLQIISLKETQFFYNALNSNDEIVTHNLVVEQLNKSVNALNVIQCQAFLLKQQFNDLLIYGYQYSFETKLCKLVKISLEAIFRLRTNYVGSLENLNGEPIYICGDCKLPEMTKTIFMSAINGSYLINWKTQKICSISFTAITDPNPTAADYYNGFENNGKFQICNGAYPPYTCWLLDINTQTITTLDTSRFQKFQYTQTSVFKKGYNDIWFIGTGANEMQICNYNPDGTFTLGKNVADIIETNNYQSCSVQLNSTFGVLAGGFKNLKSFFVDIQNEDLSPIDNSLQYRRGRGCGWYRNSDGKIEIIYFGGFSDPLGAPESESEIFSLETKSWNYGPNYPLPTGKMMIVQKDGYFYSIGGYSHFTHSSTYGWNKKIFRFDHNKVWTLENIELIHSTVYNHFDIPSTSSLDCP